jgi:hypothetical protein
VGVSESVSAPGNVGDYCRQIEAYLCRRNDGHLIRIVGPAFERVSAWAGQGIPLKVAFQGIDRYVDRQAAKGPRRRPVRVEFCDADVLDAFDQWRRAVGAVAGPVAPTGSAAESSDESGAPAGLTRGDEELRAVEAPAACAKRVALQAHIDRVLARLTQRRLDAGIAPVLGEAIDRLLAALDALRPRAHGARGEQREEVRRALDALDRELLDAARAACAAEELARIDVEARRDLQPFRERMPAAAFEQAVSAAAARLLRESARVPEISPGM